MSVRFRLSWNMRAAVAHKSTVPQREGNPPPMLWIVLSELLAFVAYFLYGSFFEWVFHKYLFHSPRFLKAAFRAHTLIHHQVFKFEPASYEWHEGPGRTQEQRTHVTMDWFALPLFLGFHLPFFWAIEHFTGWKS